MTMVKDVNVATMTITAQAKMGGFYDLDARTVDAKSLLKMLQTTIDQRDEARAALQECERHRDNYMANNAKARGALKRILARALADIDEGRQGG